MNIKIISIGDELASGQRLDTNSQWLSQRLVELGIAVAVSHHRGRRSGGQRRRLSAGPRAGRRGRRHRRAGPHGRRSDARRAGRGRSASSCISTSRRSITFAALFARHNRPDARAERPAGHVSRRQPADLQSRRNRPGHLSSSTRGPSGRPASCSPCRACRPKCGRCSRHRRAGRRSPLLGEPRVIRHRRIKCFGAGESQLEQMLPDLIRRGREPSVGITVHEATITLRITAAGRTAEASAWPRWSRPRTRSAVRWALWSSAKRTTNWKTSSCGCSPSVVKRCLTVKSGLDGLLGPLAFSSGRCRALFSRGCRVAQRRGLESMAGAPRSADRSIRPVPRRPPLHRACRERFASDFASRSDRSTEQPRAKTRR